eukprot:9786279-Alexandrium_andersonii.AAC.1
MVHDSELRGPGPLRSLRRRAHDFEPTRLPGPWLPQHVRAGVTRACDRRWFIIPGPKVARCNSLAVDPN